MERGDLADAVIVIDRGNRNFRKLGKIEKFERGGEVIVRLSDEELLHLDHNNYEKTIKIFYRNKNKKGKRFDELKLRIEPIKEEDKWYERVPKQFGRGPVSLFETYYELGNQVSDFFRDYRKLFGEYPC
jgi:hypothetical protein